MPAIVDAPAGPALDFRHIGDEIADLTRKREKTIQVVADGITWALAAPELTKKIWRAYLESDARQVHELRSAFFFALDRDIELIRTILQILPQATQLAGASFPNSERLPSIRKELEDFREILDERWQTLEDVEAMIASEKIALTEDRLRELAVKYPPPQSWFEETEKPF
jgi:hypothetical protein